MTGENQPSELHEVEVDIVDSEESTRPKWLLGLGGLVAAGAIVAGVAIVATNDDSAVDVAAEDDNAGAEDTADETSGPLVTTTTVAAEPASNVATPTTAGPVEFATDFAADAAFGGGFGGPGSVVFDGEQFVGLGYSDSGIVIRTSANGIDWDDRSVPGFENGHAWQLAEHDGTYATIVEVWDEEDAEISPFGAQGRPSFQLAVSTDLENWTFTDLSIDAGENQQASVSNLALSSAGVVILAETYNVGPDEMQVLFEAGILTEEHFDTYCGLQIDVGEITVNSCDYNDFEDEEIDFEAFERAYDEAETDKEREALAQEFETLSQPPLEIIATITPDDPLFDELSGIYDYEYEDTGRTVVLAGPLGSPLTMSTLPAPGHATGVMVVGGTFVTAITNYGELGESTTIFTSTDGLVWVNKGEAPAAASSEIQVLGDSTLVLAGQEDFINGPAVYTSQDLGASWQQVDVDIELYGAYPRTIAGPAGAVVLITGSTEEFNGGGFAEPPEIAIVKDGYTFTMDNFEGGITLTGPNGEVIHSLTAEEVYGNDDEDIPNVVRTNPITGNPTFLDPETGEDLVSFSTSDFDRAYEEAFGGFDEEIVEPNSATVVLFSADGVTWTELNDDRLNVNQNNGSIEAIAVGDDELIVGVYSWNQPPDELFAFEGEGREPTEEEIAALNEWESGGRGDSFDYFRIDLG